MLSIDIERSQLKITKQFLRLFDIFLRNFQIQLASIFNVISIEEMLLISNNLEAVYYYYLFIDCLFTLI